MENPFTDPIFEILLNANQPLKIHEISQALKPLQQTELDKDPNRHLFKLNFLIMNALYQLQHELSNEYWIHISCLHIALQPKPNSPAQQSVTAQPEHLKSYYLDWQNYHTSADVIAQLLADFWQQLHMPASKPNTLSRREALALFELNEGASFNEIKNRWRKLALIYHPDRGVHSPERFKRYLAAWQALKYKHDCIS